MRHLLRFTFIAVVFAAAMAVASASFAAPVTWQSVDVSLRPEGSGGVYMVSGTLPKNASLPAEAELAVPAGSTIQWIGEILGGPPSADPELKYTKSTVNGLDVYRFTLTKARIAQVEVPSTDGAKFDGTSYLSSLKWSAWQAVPTVNMNVRMPQGAQVAQAVPGATVLPGESAKYSYYSKTFKDVKAGDQLDLSFGYTLPAVGAAQSAGSSAAGSDTFAIVIIVAVFIGGFVLLVYNVRRKMRGDEVDEAQAVAPKRSASAGAPSSQAKPRKGQPEPVETVRAPRKIKPAFVILSAVGVLVVAVLIAGNNGTTAKAVNGKVTRSFGGASPCTSASIPVTANDGVDLASQGDELLKAFDGMEGIGDVTIDLASQTVEAKFCESKQTEDSMRQALASTGLVTFGAAAAPPVTATVDSGGKKQSATVDTAGSAFTPGKVLLKAGVPADIAFGKAEGCITEVIFSTLGVNQDLKAGPATVSLPALEPGTYPFACPMGHQSGELVVQ